MNRFFIISLFSFLLFFSIMSFANDDDEIQSLLLQLESCENDTAKISLFIQIANAYKYNNSAKMQDYSQKAYNLSINIKNDIYTGKSVLCYADAYLYVSNLDSTQFYLNKEKDLIYSLNDSSLISNWLLLQGTVFRRKYKFSESKECFLKCIHNAGVKNIEIKADAYSNLGIVHKQQGMYDSAITFYIKSQKFYKILEDSSGLVRVFVNTGKVYFILKDYQKAKAYYIKALDIVENLDNLDYRCAVYQNIGTVYRMSEDYSEALKYYKKALEIAEFINIEIDIGDINNSIGDSYFLQGLYDQALKHFEKSALIFKNLNYYQGELTAKNNIALVYFEKNNYPKGFAMMDTVLQLAIKNDLTEKILMAYNSIAINLYDYGKYQPAYDTLREWIELKDSIFNIEKTKIITDLELKYEKEKNESKILVLQNEALQKDIEIKQKINQRNLISGGGIAAVIILSLLFFLNRQRSRKDRIIKEKEILRLKEEKKALAAQSIVEGQEEERKRIARELHDGLGVLLSNVKMQFSSFMDKSVGNKEMLTKAAGVLNQASVDVRRISQNMMPGNLSKFGLLAAIEDLFEELNDAGKINAEIKDDLADERFSENIEIMLYRIVQELVNNTIKHSGATAISLNLNKFDNKILVRYSDNGVGFDPEKAKSGKSMGLKSIEDRINFLGGNLTIESALGEGAGFVFDFPF